MTSLRRLTVFQITLACLLAFVLTSYGNSAEQKSKLNVLLITVDDMNCDSVGVYGCPVPGTTPNIDSLAAQGMRFEHGHVTIAVCQPTRAVWMTGRYPHRNGALGFERISAGVPTMLETLRDAGYYTGIMAKVSHVVPSRGRAWSKVVRATQLKTGRDPDLYYQHAKIFFDEAKKSGKPCFLMANSQDPHRPFARSDQEARFRKAGQVPKVINPFRPADVVVPGFLPDLPDVRLEMAEYYTSVRRADAITGAVLRALDESGLAETTVVMFLSDHGMPLPFAKTNCFYHSTRTPWIVRWPGVTKPGSIDGQHFVSGIDLFPTLMEAIGVETPAGVDGRSFVAVLKGETQSDRERVFTHFHRTAGRKDYSMRSVLDHRFGYIYNDWADGKTRFRNESQSGRTMKAMVAAAKDNEKIASRVAHFLYRTPEELYDYANDPDALNNLIADPQHAKQVAQMRRQMLVHLQSTDDPLQESYAKFLNQEKK